MSSASRSPRDPQSGPLPAVWLDLVVDSTPSKGTLKETHGSGLGADGGELARRARQLLGHEPIDAEWAALHSARGHLRAFRSLERLAAPSTLDGRVVASLEAGHRQERASAVLSAVERVDAPAELDALVQQAIDRAATEHPAPAVLDRLVAERLADPQAGTVRSMAARLGRKRAPATLDERVLTGRTRGAGTSRPRVTAKRVLVSSAAALALILSIRLIDGPDSQPSAPGPQFTIVRIESADAAGLSAADRMFLSSFTGQTFGGRS